MPLLDALDRIPSDEVELMAKAIVRSKGRAAVQAAYVSRVAYHGSAKVFTDFVEKLSEPPRSLDGDEDDDDEKTAATFLTGMRKMHGARR